VNNDVDVVVIIFGNIDDVDDCVVDDIDEYFSCCCCSAKLYPICDITAMGIQDTNVCNNNDTHKAKYKR
jgi:hypothetical protein